MLSRIIVSLFLAGSVAFPAVAEQFASKAQIEKRLVGKTVRYGDAGRATYSPNGQYTNVRFSDGKISRGTWTISEG